MRAGKAAQQAGGLQAGSSLLQEQAGRQAPDLHNQILTESSHNWQEGFSFAEMAEMAFQFAGPAGGGLVDHVAFQKGIGGDDFGGEGLGHYAISS